MNTSEFLAQLNVTDRGLGLWISRENLQEHHVGHYAFDNDRIPKFFIHAGSLEELAHLRQKHILNNPSSTTNEWFLGREWADNFLSKWQAQWLVQT
jgi:hypothetical protein